LGEASPAAGLKTAHLPQEPQLDPKKDVLGNVEEGVAETRALLTRFEEVSAKLGEPIDADEMEKLLDEQARLQDSIDAANAWDLDRTIELAMDALRVPPGDMDVTKISRGERRRAAHGRAPRVAGCTPPARTCCCSPSRPTTSMPSRSPGSSAT